MESKSKELELLIKRVTAEVVGAVLTQPEGLASIKDLPGKRDKSLLALIPELVGDMNEFINYLKARHPEYELVLGVTGNIDVSGFNQIREAININDEPSRQRLNSMINKFDEVYLMCPEVMQIKSISDGDDRGYIEKLIIYRVLHGKNTGILLDYDINGLPSSSLTKRLKESLGSIKSMGISISLLNSHHAEESMVDTQKGKRLITEKDIEDMFRNGVNTIKAGRDYIITPLAKDRANELKMKIT